MKLNPTTPKTNHLAYFRHFFVSFPAIAVCLFASSVKAVEISDPPPARVSYWSQGGRNLASETQEISFIERRELFGLLKEEGRVTFLDIREPEEFAKSHLPKAVNAPFSSLVQDTPSLPPPLRIRGGGEKNSSPMSYEWGRLSAEGRPPKDGSVRILAEIRQQCGGGGGRKIIPYCNWDFRAYVAAVEFKQKGFTNVALMYPHGLRGWIAQGFPVAGESAGKSDEEAWREMHQVVIARSEVLHQTVQGEATKQSTNSEIASPANNSWRARNDGHSSPMLSEWGRLGGGNVRDIPLTILPKRVEPSHIEASVGDRLTLELISEEEDHWFVIPDFGVNLRLKPGERRTVTLDITRSGYFPFGCITCCTKYRCQTKQAILADLNESVERYGE